FVFRPQGARTQVEGVRTAAGVPASSTSFAFVNAMRQLGKTKVAIAATYPDDVARHFVDFLEAAGITVSSLASHGIDTAAEVGRLDADEAVDFVLSNDHSQAEVVLVPDTALHSADLIEPLEGLLGKPVLTANQVSVWEGLRLAGHSTGRPGSGALFRTRTDMTGTSPHARCSYTSRPRTTASARRPILQEGTRPMSTSGQLTPVPRRSTAEIIADQLRSAI